jgi:hypothetical protein
MAVFTPKSMARALANGDGEPGITLGSSPKAGLPASLEARQPGSLAGRQTGPAAPRIDRVGESMGRARGKHGERLGLTRAQDARTFRPRAMRPASLTFRSTLTSTGGRHVEAPLLHPPVGRRFLTTSRGRREALSAPAVSPPPCPTPRRG